MFDITTTSTSFDIVSFIINLGCALILGILVAWVYSRNSASSKNFLQTTALLPAIVCAIIYLVNGNLGASVAVAGTFSLVRFRSAPGTAKEIGILFLSMAIGLACGMGYPAFGALVAVILMAVDFLLNKINFGGSTGAVLKKTLKITAPEDISDLAVLDEVIRRYASEMELVNMKTAHLGSVIRLNYQITLKKAGTEKQLMDEIRQKNGNLEVSVSRQSDDNQEL